MKQIDQMKKPFFVQLLEKQSVIPTEENKELYPSFTYLIIDGYQTMKYPSDDDEDGTKI